MGVILKLIPYKKVPVLLYHQIATTTAEEDSNRLAVSPATFESQMQILHRQGYATISLDQLSTSHYQEKKFVLTFDDGYLDNYRVAFPILQKYGFHATCFLTTQFVGKSHAWEKCGSFPYLDWSHAREMLRSGSFAFGSHTCSHPDLTAISAAEMRREIVASKSEIEEKLGVAVDHFSYPFGNYNEAAKEVVRKAGYRSACSVSITDDDHFSLERFMITSKDSSIMFRIKADKWSSWIRNPYTWLRLHHG